ncbi:MAG: acetyl-CoA carboxylase biotin carboxyl carrier protein [Eubacteriales bacterium]|nr:acetyl-CoA carboxylase biotin carboxyl carrier protein [Eubacteriales bacterium]
MEFEKIKELMQTLDNSNLMDFELKLNDGFYLRMNKHKEAKATVPSTINETPTLKEESTDFNKAKIAKENLKENLKEDITEQKQEIKEGNIVVCPIVGTFYASSSPSKPAFVKVGDKIKEGDTLCIIEAMKVMNEIKSQFSGEVAEIFVQNEEMVEYNQPLFRIV